MSIKSKRYTKEIEELLQAQKSLDLLIEHKQNLLIKCGCLSSLSKKDYKNLIDRISNESSLLELIDLEEEVTIYLNGLFNFNDTNLQYANWIWGTRIFSSMKLTPIILKNKVFRTALVDLKMELEGETDAIVGAFLYNGKEIRAYSEVNFNSTIYLSSKLDLNDCLILEPVYVNKIKEIVEDEDQFNVTERVSELVQKILQEKLD